MSRAGILAAVTVLGAFLAVRDASAQPRDSRLLITVVDQTGGVLPGATVTIAGQDDATKSVLIEPTTASAEGVAMFVGLRPGRYAIKAEFSGFDPRVNPDVRVRAGDNKETIALAIEKLADTVNVARDRQEVAVDRATTFGSALTREQIDALSDDPDVLRQQLAEMAGGPAIIRVDSFEGAPLPPKAQIKSIHITRDGFAAENHNAGAFFIDIVTQPGIGPLRGQVQYGMRPGTLTGNSPFTPIKGPENMQAGCHRDRRHARTREELVFARAPGQHVVHDAEPQRRPSHGFSVAGAQSPDAAEQRQRPGDARLRVDEGSDAARVLLSIPQRGR